MSAQCQHNITQHQPLTLRWHFLLLLFCHLLTFSSVPEHSLECVQYLEFTFVIQILLKLFFSWSFNTNTKQVIRLKCGGFIFSPNFNHTMCDGAGLSQFLRHRLTNCSGSNVPFYSTGVGPTFSHFQHPTSWLWCRNCWYPSVDRSESDGEISALCRSLPPDL